ncbi:MAG: hypothetical protein ANABAC_2671 [Anaerolineae bacterium]|nr:MAG: hypothetical protein ANABAC_2671 [Anaerolineae bacterium]
MERNAAHIATLGFAQVRMDMFVELFFGKPYRDRAYIGSPFFLFATQ